MCVHLLFIFSTFPFPLLSIIEERNPLPILNSSKRPELFGIALFRKKVTKQTKQKNCQKIKKKFMISASETGRQKSKEVGLEVEEHGRDRGPSFLAPGRKLSVKIGTLA